MIIPIPPFQWTHLHPILVDFTAALLPSSLACDVLGKMFRRTSLTNAGWWMLAIAAAVTPFTALLGYLWRRTKDPYQGDELPMIQIHQWLGISMAVILVVLVVWRAAFFRKSAAPNIPYILVASIVMLALVYQGHLGGTLSFPAGM